MDHEVVAENEHEAEGVEHVPNEDAAAGQVAHGTSNLASGDGASDVGEG
jgi:hypothetical protein